MTCAQLHIDLWPGEMPQLAITTATNPRWPNGPHFSFSVGQGLSELLVAGA